VTLKNIFEIKAGELVNVRRPNSDWPTIYEPMMRRFVEAKIKKLKDGKWLFWYWERESRTAEGNPDCGYSAIRQDDPWFDNPVLEVAS